MTITTDQSLAAALDYLPVAVRAAHRNPDSTTLWAESIRAQREVISYADSQLPDDLAADVQSTVGSIARDAALDYDFAITEPRWAVGNYRSAAVLTERAKAHIHNLIINR